MAAVQRRPVRSFHGSFEPSCVEHSILGGVDAPRDLGAAWCWLSLAGRYGDATDDEKRIELEKTMSPAERASNEARLVRLLDQLHEDAETFRGSERDP